MNNIFDVAIIGAGPAGMMAAISAKNSKNNVCIIEKNFSFGNKLLLSGKGRCNVTSSKDIHDIVKAFGREGRFLYGVLSQFTNQDLMAFFEERGVKLKVERGDRVFPVSNDASAILNCLFDEIKRKNINIINDFEVFKIRKTNELFEIYSRSGKILSKKIVISTGGMSYPKTGSNGSGYKFAKYFGHTIIDPIPALVPLIVNDKNLNSLAGLSLKNVELSFQSNNKIFSKEFGEMLFTHKGISGPIVLKQSKDVYQKIKSGGEVIAKIDLKPRLDEITLRKRIIKEITEAPKKEYQNLLATLLPRLLILYATDYTKIVRHQQSSTLLKEQLTLLVNFLKNFNFKIDKVDSINHAIVTHGGVPIQEIDRKTMESKVVLGLYFAGEIICLDGPTGGFNMQKAFSTGYVAGKSSST